MIFIFKKEEFSKYNLYGEYDLVPISNSKKLQLDQ
jgi:hypothetical protein